MKVTSTSVCQTPVTPEGPTTASNSPTATAVNAALDIQVLTDVHIASLILTGVCLSEVSKWFKAAHINLVCVLQASVVTKCLMAVKGDPAGMEEHVLWLVTHRMVSSANVHP